MDGLFEMPTQRLAHGDVVDVDMSWGETWHCEVSRVVYQDGWPKVLVHQLGHSFDDAFEVDVARCHLVAPGGA